MSDITRKTTRAVEKDTATNGTAVVAVINVLTKNEVRIETSWTSNPGAVQSMAKMTRQHAVALRDALNQMDI